MAARFSIDIWSDVVCPFCYLGSRQLALAIESFEHRDDVVVNHHAFELDPHTPLTLDTSLAQLVADKYAMPVEQAETLHLRLESQAHELGMTWSMASARPTNTFDAHRLIALATTQGLGDEMSERLFAAYFSEGLLVSDHDTLSRLASDVGVTDVSSLWATDAFSMDVRADESAAQDLGVTGVPAILIDNKFMVLGAQGVDKIADVLRRAWERRAA
ncbi:MAG TPA: DsbA family oxidoreductase [Acidimicrobiales bacterium]|nr:DsbA family oxidoreductase [Acidimicrobiales bacterium]